MHKAILIATASAILSGCATKDFGRIASSGSALAMTCPEIAAAGVELAEFRARVEEKSKIDGRSIVAATLLDFGIGNMRDKKRALASAARREAELAQARFANGC